MDLHMFNYCCYNDFVGLLAVINLQNKRIDAANNYIETVANTQAFIKWYSLENYFD